MIRVRIGFSSPFARKCRIAAAHLQLLDRVSFVDAPFDESDAMRRRNPLNKIPVAILEDGSVLYDSRVILEYFDHLAGGNCIIPHDPAQRFPTLRLQALADGIMDAAVLIIYETRYRQPQERGQQWIDHQTLKMDRALDELERDPPGFSVDVGTITLACALGFLDLRYKGLWREAHPHMVAWLDTFAAQVPAFEATRAPG